jgi:hypothetical protein
MSETMKQDALELPIESGLRGVSSRIAECSSVAASCFKDASAAVRRQTQSCDAALAAAQLASRGSAQSLAEARDQFFRSLLDGFAHCERDLSTASAELQQANALLDGLGKIAVQSTFLALQAAVEGAWTSGAAARDFTLAADSIKQLAMSMRESIRQVEDVIHLLRSKLGSLTRLIPAACAGLDETQQSCARLSSELGASLADFDALSSTAFAELRECIGRVAASKNEAMTALQFDDLSQQLIQHILRSARGEASSAKSVLQSDMSSGGVELF